MLDHPAFAQSCPYLTRWKMRRSRVLRWVRESWSMTEYTPRTVSFLSWRPEEKPPVFRGSFYFFLLFRMVLLNTSIYYLKDVTLRLKFAEP